MSPRANDLGVDETCARRLQIPTQVGWSPNADRAGLSVRLANPLAQSQRQVGEVEDPHHHPPSILATGCSIRVTTRLGVLASEQRCEGFCAVIGSDGVVWVVEHSGDCGGLVAEQSDGIGVESHPGSGKNRTSSASKTCAGRESAGTPRPESLDSRLQSVRAQCRCRSLRSGASETTLRSLLSGGGAPTSLLAIFWITLSVT